MHHPKEIENGTWGLPACHPSSFRIEGAYPLILFYLNLAPNGNNESFAILKCCIPNGIPTMVMQQTRPKTRWVNAISHQPKIAQRMLNASVRQPSVDFDRSTSRPNG